MKRAFTAISAVTLLLVVTSTADAQYRRGRVYSNSYSPVWYSSDTYYRTPGVTYVAPSNSYRSHYYEPGAYYERPGYYYDRSYYGYPRSGVYVNTPYVRWRIR